MTLDASTLSKLRELCEAATLLGEPCPEHIYLFARGSGNLVAQIRTNHKDGPEQERRDYNFYHTARSALPLLLDAYEKLQGENERLHRVIAKELTENDEIGAEYTYVVCLQDENRKLRELLHDLNAVLKTAMHNGHHDLIQRVSDVCKDEAQFTVRCLL